MIHRSFLRLSSENPYYITYGNAFLIKSKEGSDIALLRNTSKNLVYRKDFNHNSELQWCLDTLKTCSCDNGWRKKQCNICFSQRRNEVQHIKAASLDAVTTSKMPQKPT